MTNRLTVIIALAAAALVPAGLPAQGARRAPGFCLPDSKMELHDLADYRGKPVILEFMQTTCPHCQRLAGHFGKPAPEVWRPGGHTVGGQSAGQPDQGGAVHRRA